MRIPLLIEQLAVSDPEQRQAAADALVAAGAHAVGPLVATLRSPAPWWTKNCMSVLRRIGDPAFWPLVDALANVDGSQTDLETHPIGWALKGLQVSDRDRFVDLLRHDSPNVRFWACRVFAAMRAEALPYIPVLLPLLADGNPGVRGSACSVFAAMRAEALPYLPVLLLLLADPVDDVRRISASALEAMRPDVVPVLHEIRRSSVPYRRHALTGLAEIGGWEMLDPADQALVRRLIRIKIPHEVPTPFVPCGMWFAVPTRDHAAVLDMFDLSDATTVTMRLGQAAASNDFLRGNMGIAYITPVLDGWTLVFVWSEEFHDRAAALSRRFGTAHAYYLHDDEHGSGLGTAWCIAEKGEIVRYYSNEDPTHQIGPPHPTEQGYLLPHEDDNTLDGTEWCVATDVAARTSLNPETLGPHIRVEGHAVLALTVTGRQNGTAPGALPI